MLVQTMFFDRSPLPSAFRATALVCGNPPKQNKRLSFAAMVGDILPLRDVSANHTSFPFSGLMAQISLGTGTMISCFSGEALKIKGVV